jgi:alpha-tubulin suppressor-like RCC1 family protein
VGGQHNCALLDDGTVKCWGQNGSGQLGVGDTTTRGDMAGQMGDNLPAVNLGAGRKAVAIGTGHNHTCAILDDHHTKCWGANSSGQLGLGDMADRGKTAASLGAMLPNVDLGR